MTTSDAIALGSMIAALTAACMGLIRGDQARVERRQRPAPPSLPPAQSDLRALAEAVRDLVDVLRATVAPEPTRDLRAETLRDLLDRLDRRPS